MSEIMFGLISNLIFYFKLHGILGGLIFAKGLVTCNTEKVYVFDFKKNIDEALLNSKIEKLIIESTRDFNLIESDYFKICGKYLTEISKSSLTNSDNFVALYLEEKFVGWGWFKYGPFNQNGIEISKGKAFIHNCRTLREFRRNRVYTTLLISTLNYLKERGITQVFISVKDFNTPSIGAIEKVGFEFFKETSKGNLFNRIIRYSKI